MSDKHRSEGHEITGLNNENKNRFSNATSKFHGRSGQARVNSQSNPTTGRTCWICSSRKITERRLKWHEHVMRMEEDHVVRRVMTKAIPGERKRGRPKTRWKDVCKRDMQTV